jgi:hypothetical protein
MATENQWVINDPEYCDARSDRYGHIPAHWEVKAQHPSGAVVLGSGTTAKRATHDVRAGIRVADNMLSRMRTPLTGAPLLVDRTCRYAARCECCGFGFFWGLEIDGYRGRSSDRLPCRKCNRLNILQRLRLWWLNYRSNEQVV